MSKIIRRSVRLNPGTFDHSTKELPNHDEWILAAGTCGMNLGDRPVYATYVNGVALFAYQSNLGHYSCSVTGQLTCGGDSLHEAMDAGALEALKWGVLEADRRYSRKKFQEIVNDSTRLN
jgi:hypothetical protein